MDLAMLLAVAGLAQTPAPAKLPLPVELPAVANATADPTCGNRPALAERATCVVSTQAGVEGVLQAYEAVFTPQGWLVADASGNVVIYMKRKPEGGCDAFQVLAFADGEMAAPAAPAYLAFATIPRDICQAADPNAAAPAQ
ncbi:hypothetical protein ACIQC9_12165 [Brevundimonas sp. NPDC092305]|uniref:hypothetical protein n=1 Tax=Brevundimonas sp. NPDC092305 TaxID=3363957 RepID=UPI003803FE33